MAEVTIEPGTIERFDDIQQALSGGGDGSSCQCMWWLLPSKDWDTTTRDGRRDMFREEVAGGPPGLLAYVDGEPAAWVRVGPRPNQPRLALTRAYAASEEPWDDPDVWAVSCFVVRREFRVQGLSARLLDAALEFAGAAGARVVEAYPIDVSVRKMSANELFHGSLSTFADAGFREVARPKPHVAIVALDIAGASAATGRA